MKFVRVVPAIAALALSTLSLAGPAHAGQVYVGNGLSKPAPSANDKGPDRGSREVLVQHVDEVQKYGKNDICRFPIAVRAQLTIRDVITNNGDRVDETSRGKVTVTNLSNHRSIKLRVDDRAVIDVDNNDNISGYARGKSLVLNDDISVFSKRQGRVSAANRGHQADEGAYYIQGAYAFRVEKVSTEDAASEIYVKRGRVLDVCKALAGHHHKKH